MLERQISVLFFLDKEKHGKFQFIIKIILNFLPSKAAQERIIFFQSLITKPFNKLRDRPKILFPSKSRREPLEAAKPFTLSNAVKKVSQNWPFLALLVKDHL